jgi:hypothetical protein
MPSSANPAIRLLSAQKIQRHALNWRSNVASK